MEDLFNIPNIDQNVQFFTSDSTNWQIWSKPRNAKFVFIYAIGGGGGGAAGVSGSPGTNRAGGGGGAASNVTRFFIPASLIPDILYVLVGRGGAGGTSGSIPGSNGEISYVGYYPNTGTTSILVQSSLLPASGATSSSGGGSPSTFARSTITQLFGQVQYFSSAQSIVNGSAGSSNSVGGNKSPLGIVSGGAGGAGASNVNASFNGGNIVTTAWNPTISGGAGGISGSNGSPGYQGYNIGANNSQSKPLWFTGGSGGGSHGTSTAFSGGDGAIGCGGGGGGGGVTGGAGGRGGDGLVIIISY